MKGMRYGTAITTTPTERGWGAFCSNANNPFISIAPKTANFPVQAFKRGNSRMPSFGTLPKGTTLPSHTRVISSIPISIGRQSANCYRSREQKKIFNNEEFLTATEPRATVRQSPNAFDNYIVTLAADDVSENFNFVRFGTASISPPLRIVKRVSNRKKITEAPPILNAKEIKHIAVLLGTAKQKTVNGKQPAIKSIKRGSVNYLEPRGRTAKDCKRMDANLGVSGKRYSPTSKYLHMKKVTMIENKIADLQDKCPTTEEAPRNVDNINSNNNNLVLFTDSFMYDFIVLLLQ